MFVILMEVVGTVALGLILGSLSSMFMVRATASLSLHERRLANPKSPFDGDHQTSRLLEDKVERQLAELREYLTEKRVPKKLRGRVRHYMELLYRHKTVRHKREIHPMPEP